MIDQIKSLTRKGGFKKYFFNTFWLFQEKIVKLLSAVVVGIWVARYLGPSDFGILSYAISFLGIGSVVAGLGLDSIVVRELVKGKVKDKHLLGSAFFLKLIMGVFTPLALIMISMLLGNSSNERVVVGVVSMAIIFQAFGVVDFYFQSYVLSRFTVIGNIVTTIISASIKLVLIYLDSPLKYFAYVYFIESIVLASCFVIAYYARGENMFHWRFKVSIAKMLIKESWLLIMSGLVIVIYMKIDQIMIKEMLDNRSIGTYAAAVRISEAWYFIPVVISSSLFPSIISAKKSGELKYMERIQSLFNVMVWVSMVFAIPMTFLSPYIIEFLYGQDFIESAAVLSVHIWTGVFVALGVASGKWLVNESLHTISFYRTLIGAILNVILNFILIPGYGIYGAAISTLLAQIVAAYVYDVFDPRMRKIFLMKTKALLFLSLRVK